MCIRDSSHGGGKTALAKEGLNYEKEEPDYIHSVDSPESKEAPPEIAEWTAEFSKDKVLQAVRSLEKSISKLETIQIGKKGASGRAITLNISGQEVSATAVSYTHLDVYKRQPLWLVKLALQSCNRYHFLVLNGLGILIHSLNS